MLVSWTGGLLDPIGQSFHVISLALHSISRRGGAVMPPGPSSAYQTAIRL